MGPAIAALLGLATAKDMCMPGSFECKGNVIRSCDLNRRWINIPCPQGTECQIQDGETSCLRRDGRRPLDILGSTAGPKKGGGGKKTGDDDDEAPQENGDGGPKPRAGGSKRKPEADDDGTPRGNGGDRPKKGKSSPSSGSPDDESESDGAPDKTIQKPKKGTPSDGTPAARKTKTVYVTKLKYAKKDEDDEESRPDKSPKKTTVYTTVTAVQVIKEKIPPTEIKFEYMTPPGVLPYIGSLPMAPGAGQGGKAPGGGGSGGAAGGSAGGAAGGGSGGGSDASSGSSANAGASSSSDASGSSGGSAGGGSGGDSSGGASGGAGGDSSGGASGGAGGDSSGGASGGAGGDASSGASSDASAGSSSQSSGGGGAPGGASSGSSSDASAGSSSQSGSGSGPGAGSSSSSDASAKSSSDASSSGGGGSSGGGVITEQQLNSAMKTLGFQPKPEYAKAVVKITNEKIKDKNEAAMFLAQLAHESGGYKYIEEIACTGPGSCKGQYGTGAPGKNYHGRGFIQLSWPDNYKAAGKGLGMGDKLYQNPDQVAKDPNLGAQVSYWFWKNRVVTAPGVKGFTKFGATTKAINGALECKGQNVAQSKKRYDAYKALVKVMKISKPASESGCYN